MPYPSGEPEAEIVVPAHGSAPDSSLDYECELLLISTGTVREIVDKSPSGKSEPTVQATTDVSDIIKKPDAFASTIQPLTTTREGRMQVFQQEIPNTRGDNPDQPGSFIAVLSIEDCNVPLGLGHTCEHFPGRPVWDVSDESGRVFRVECTGSVEQQNTLQDIMAWFLQLDGMREKGWAEKAIDDLGRKGEVWVDKMGQQLNTKILQKMRSSKLDADDNRTASPTEADGTMAQVSTPEGKRNLKLGGVVTKSVLGGALKVTQVGANVAGKITNKASDMVGGIIGNNPIMRNMRNAPEGSKRKSTHRILASTMGAAGRVYLKFDEHGQIIVTNVANETSNKAGEEYGEEAQSATKNIAFIGLNSYRIARFPAKLGASSLVKGAMKGVMLQETQASNVSSTVSAQNKFVPGAGLKGDRSS